MRRSVTSDGQPSCPLCASYGVETETEEVSVLLKNFHSVDDGCTRPLLGVLCAECARVVADARAMLDYEGRE